MAEVQNNWPKVEELQIEFSSRRKRTYCWYTVENGSLLLSANAVTEEQATEILNSLVASVPAALNDERLPLSGERRTYYLPGGFSEGLFDKLIHAIQEKVPASRTAPFNAELTIEKDSTSTRRTFNELQSWAATVIREFSATRFTNFNLYGRTIEIRGQLDPRRELLNLEINATTSDEYERLFNEIADALALEPTVGDIYVVRSESTYRIRAWRNRRLAKALGNAFRQFVGSTPAFLENASRIVDEDGTVSVFRSLDDLLKRAAEDTPFKELHVAAEGPRGAGLSVNVWVDDSGLRRLRIRSSVEQAEFKQLVRAVEDGVSIDKEISVDKEGKPESNWVKIGAPLLALVVGSVLSPAFLSAASAETTVAITVPVKAPGQDTVVTSSPFRVEWELTREQWFTTTIERDARADVRIVAESNQNEIMELKDRPPGVQLDLKPGSYDIEVVDEESSASARTRVEVR
jgi:hypothetical protein